MVAQVNNPIELDLFFQIYRQQIEDKFGKQNIKLLIEGYNWNYTPEEYYNAFIYLPF